MRGLPGVVDVQPLQGIAGEGIEILTEDAAQASRLDDVLADTIEGREVRFTYSGPEIAPAPVDFYPAEDIVKDYGSILKSLPGVTHVGTVSVKMGAMLPAFETAIELKTENRSQAYFLSDMLEPEIQGTKLTIDGIRHEY